MPKDQIAQELAQEFAQGNFKPSQLKRSKSLSDIPTAPPLPNNPNSELTAQIAALHAHNSQLEDKILELRLKNLQDFSAYHAEKKAFKNKLEQSINYGTKEIENLENKLRNLNRKKITLEQQVFTAQSEAKKWELKVIDGENKTSERTTKPSSPGLNLWPLWLSLGGLLILGSMKGINDD